MNVTRLMAVIGYRSDGGIDYLKGVLDNRNHGETHVSIGGDGYLILENSERLDVWLQNPKSGIWHFQDPRQYYSHLPWSPTP